MDIEDTESLLLSPASTDSISQVIDDAFAGRADDAIVTAIVNAVRQYLATEPPFAPTVLARLGTFREHVLNRCGLDTTGAVFGMRLALALRDLAGEHFQVRSDVADRRNREAWHDTRSTTLPLEAVETAKLQFGLRELRYLASFSAGRSGSHVLKVYLRRNDGSEALSVLKLTSSEEDFQREVDGHQLAANSWLKQWVSTLPHQATWTSEAPERDFFALLSPLAFPPTKDSDEILSLHDVIIKGPRAGAQHLAQQIGAAYAANLKNLPDEQRLSIPVSEYFSMLLGHWQRPAKDGAWHDDSFWTEAGLPPPREECFLDGESILCNPLWLAQKFPSSARRIFFKAFQHGDLNARNLLLSDNMLSPGQMIDFEKACENSPLLDLCWLSLWSLVSSKRSVPLTVEQWNEIPSVFVTAFAGGKDIGVDVGILRDGVELASKLTRGVRSLSKELKDVHTSGFWKNRITEHLYLTLGAAAMAMGYYEVRNVIREIDRGNQGTEMVRVSTLWGICFFRIAAHALKRYVPRSFSTLPSRDIRKLISVNVA